jgi:hypothetical protein
VHHDYLSEEGLFMRRSHFQLAGFGAALVLVAGFAAPKLSGLPAPPRDPVQEAIKRVLKDATRIKKVTTWGLAYAEAAKAGKPLPAGPTPGPGAQITAATMDNVRGSISAIPDPSFESNVAALSTDMFHLHGDEFRREMARRVVELKKAEGEYSGKKKAIDALREGAVTVGETRQAARLAADGIIEAGLKSGAAVSVPAIGNLVTEALSFSTGGLAHASMTNLESAIEERCRVWTKFGDDRRVLLLTTSRVLLVFAQGEMNHLQDTASLITERREEYGTATRTLNAKRAQLRTAKAALDRSAARIVTVRNAIPTYHAEVEDKRRRITDLDVTIDGYTARIEDPTGEFVRGRYCPLGNDLSKCKGEDHAPQRAQFQKDLANLVALRERAYEARNTLRARIRNVEQFLRELPVELRQLEIGRPDLERRVVDLQEQEAQATRDWDDQKAQFDAVRGSRTLPARIVANRREVAILTGFTTSLFNELPACK